MILVAFVLVLVATVMLIIGTFFDGGVAYIWISIGACVATFGVLAASYFARRRGADDEGARPQPLGAGESRPAAVGSGPRGTTVPGSGTATRTREEPDTDVEAVPEDTEDEAEAEEPTVTIVPSDDDRQPAEEQDGHVTADEAAPAAEEAPEPAPRRVAPRRVVRRAEPAADPAAAEAAPTWPTSTDVSEEPAPEEPATDDTADTEDVAAPTAQRETRKVVRRVQSGGTRKVVRRVQSSGGSGGTRKVVRRAGAAQAGGQRTVKRVVRRAPAGTADAAPDTSEQKSKATTRSGGTRGKRARAVLSEIKGVGPAKQDALLKRFGSLEDMADASIAELAEVKGVGESVAQAIKDSLQDR